MKKVKVSIQDEYTYDRSGKKWVYVIIPHDRINLGVNLQNLLNAN